MEKKPAEAPIAKTNYARTPGNGFIARTIETPDYSSKCKKGNTPPVSTKSDDFSAGTTENLARHTKFSQIFYLGTLRYFYLAIINIMVVLYVLCSDES